MRGWVKAFSAVLAAAALVVGGDSRAQTPGPGADVRTAPAPTPEGAPVETPIDRVALEAFVDGLVTAEMRSEQIAGVGVSIVYRGETVLLKGYGQAKADGAKVDPERSLFRIASISKTFTWIALMQLVEQGKVSLDADITTYLPPPLHPSREDFDAPILVRHLMTHSAGFEDLYAGHLFIADAAGASPLLSALSTYKPARVRPPGQTIVYSNYGTALAGAIVQRVSGLPFEDYVEQKILAPLGLQNTTFREPYGAKLAEIRALPSPMAPALAADLSDGFVARAGGYAKQPFEYVVQFAPAGSASATPADMARYMSALLAGGGGVVKPETLALFAAEKPLKSNAPGINGIAFGMMQTASPGGWRAWGHGGDTLWFHSMLALYPELDLGVFITTNTKSGTSLRNILPGLIADRIGGANPNARAVSQALPEGFSLARFAGEYFADRRSYTTTQKAFCVIGCVISVAPGPDQSLVLSAGESTRVHFVDTIKEESGALIHRFRSAETGGVSAFEERDGRIVALYGASGITRAQKIAPFESPAVFLLALLLGGLAAFLALASGLSRLFTHRPHATAARFAGVLLPLTGLAWLFALGALGMHLSRVSANEWLVFSDWPGALLTFSVWANLGAGIMTALSLVAVLAAWLNADWSVWRRTRILATLGLMIGLGVMLWRWNLLGPHF